MRTVKKWKKRRCAGVAAALTCVALAGVGSTMAYFHETETKINTFTVGDLDLGMKEPEWDDDKDGKNMFPGYTEYKNPTVKNITSDKNGSEPCYVRMKVEFLDEKGKTVTDEKIINLIKKTLYYDASFTGTYDTAGKAEGLVAGRIPGYSLKDLSAYPMVNPLWLIDEKRSTPSRLVYNYMGKEKDGILDIGEESTLFTNVVIPTDWNQSQMKVTGDFRVQVTAQAIQAHGFANQASAMVALDQETGEKMPNTVTDVAEKTVMKPEAKKGGEAL